MSKKMGSSRSKQKGSSITLTFCYQIYYGIFEGFQFFRSENLNKTKDRLNSKCFSGLMETLNIHLLDK